MMHERAALLRALDAWRQGRAEAPIICKWGNGLATATATATATAAATPAPAPAARELAAGPGEPLTVIASTGAIDRHGDTVSPDGWRLDAYRANPVILWAHDYRQPAIGRAPAVWRAGPALLARLEFAPTDFARTVASLYRQGYQRGVSVGFRPLRFEERRDARSGAFLGIRFLEQELLEISAVPVPANQGALLRAADYDANANANSNANAAAGPGPDTPAATVVSLLRALRM